ncbi:uncharacterized protein EURHEDRAFT_380765 [Aspergillus ruber CBS 135680]|uniref:FAS1 domain-containing protein n=1 Tax=Aspergillus ruber (strain CBS 135680) TaxID=1388766 RepID=A0A017S6P1_ASPRC|nr:uncharacterized protein EURHEDRAFT_380765 [Aspergillus ruber CBS 135680]EYE91840.1 hypothetical protein EURHEDRAFT_380765 [Aspergillus ruber CBS 135680]
MSSSNGPIIADILSKTRLVNTYASLTREFESALSHINNPSKQITILAPRNSAIHNLPHKPWENPEDYERLGEVNAYEGREGKDRAQGNLKRFVEGHIVGVCPWGEGEEAETLCGKKVRWVRERDRMVIEPGHIEVDHVAEKVSNGEVWILNGVLDPR